MQVRRALVVVACAGVLWGCGREELAQPARDHRSVDEAAVSLPDEGEASAPARTERASARTTTSTRRIGGAPMWADSKRYSAQENASYQFDQHGEELGAKDLDDFLKKAHAFVADPPAGAKTLVRANGDHLYYDAKSGLFGVAREDGAPRTVFKPRDGDAYWAAQVRENSGASTTARRSTSRSGGEG